MAGYEILFKTGIMVPLFTERPVSEDEIASILKRACPDMAEKHCIEKITPTGHEMSDFGTMVKSRTDKIGTFWMPPFGGKKRVVISLVDPDNWKKKAIALLVPAFMAHNGECLMTGLCEIAARHLGKDEEDVEAADLLKLDKSILPAYCIEPVEEEILIVELRTDSQLAQY